MTEAPQLPDHAALHVELFVRHKQIDVHLHLRAKSRARRTSAIRAVERKHARRKLLQPRAMNRTRVLFAKQMVSPLYRRRLAGPCSLSACAPPFTPLPLGERGGGEGSVPSVSLAITNPSPTLSANSIESVSR